MQLPFIVLSPFYRFSVIALGDTQDGGWNKQLVVWKFALPCLSHLHAVVAFLFLFVFLSGLLTVLFFLAYVLTKHRKLFVFFFALAMRVARLLFFLSFLFIRDNAPKLFSANL